MLQRGRIGRASLLAFPVDIAETRLKPPSWLTREEKKLFSEIVGSCRAKHFTQSDESLLCSFVQACLLSRRSIKKAAKDRGALLVWERSTKLMGILATKLRLAPQSRIDAQSVARGRPSVPVGQPRPWED
jgi:hypothetical protein